MSSTFQFVPLNSPEIFESEKAPLASRFDDIYFHRENGLEESLYTYVDANKLDEKWRTYKDSKQAFNVGELGFGTGLNFFATLLRWQKFYSNFKPTFWLHYFSCEQFPLPSKALKFWAQQSLGEHFKDLRAVVEQFLTALPPKHSGFYTVEFPHIQVKLVLCYGDARNLLNEIDDRHTGFQAWYLDGFDPKKNPELWEKKLLRRIFDTTTPNGSVSTFTSAGFVRRALTDAGFDVAKRKGFGKKREMLVASRLPYESKQRSKLFPPWFDCAPSLSTDRSIIIIGAGIAGCALANKLARRNWKVILIDERDDIARQASGNPSALVYPSISSDINKATQLYLHCFHYACSEYGKLQKIEDSVIQSEGILFRIDNDNRFRALSSLFLQGSSFHAVSNLKDTFFDMSLQDEIFDGNAIYFPRGLTVDARKVCQLYTQHPNIERKTSLKIEQIRREENSWTVGGATEEIDAQVLCLCTGSETGYFDLAKYFPIDRVRGQLSLIQSQQKLQALRSSFCFGHYFTPSANGWHTLGATFERLQTDPNSHEDRSVKAKDRSELIDSLAKVMPESIMDEIVNSDIKDRVGIRCSSNDHLPIVGPLVQAEQFLKTYQSLKRGYAYHQYPEAPTLPGAFIFSGLGARGFLTAPLLAEALASVINNELIPLPFSLWKLVHSNRFLIRQLQR